MSLLLWFFAKIRSLYFINDVDSNFKPRLNFLLVVHYFLLVACCLLPLLFTHYFLLELVSALCLLFFARYLLLSSHYFLQFSQRSLMILSHLSFLKITRNYFCLFTFYEVKGKLLNKATTRNEKGKYTIFYRQHNNKQHQAETGKKSSKTLREKCQNKEFFPVRMQENTDQEKLRIWTLLTQWKLSNTLRLNFCHLKIIRFLHPRYHPKK